MVDDDDDDDYQWAITNFQKSQLPVPIPKRDNNSGFKGVSRAGNRWFVRVTDPKTGNEIKLASVPHYAVISPKRALPPYSPYYPATLLPTDLLLTSSMPRRRSRKRW